MPSRHTLALSFVAALVACGGRIDVTAETSGSPPPSAPPSAPSVQPTAVTCVPPPGTELLACDLPLGIRMLTASHFVSLDEERKEAAVFEITPAGLVERTRWRDAHVMADVVGRLYVEGRRLAHADTKLYRGTEAGLDEISLQDGAVRPIDHGNVEYVRDHFYVVRTPEGTRATYRFDVNGRGEFVVTRKSDEARYYLGQTNLYDDQPTRLFAMSLSFPTNVVRDEEDQTTIGTLPVSPLDVQNRMDTLLYVQPARAGGFEIVGTSLDLRADRLGTRAFYEDARSVEAHGATSDGQDLFWVQGTDLYGYPAHGEVAAQVLANDVLDAPVPYVRPRSEETPNDVVSHVAIPVRVPGRRDRAMIIGLRTPSAHIGR